MSASPIPRPRPDRQPRTKRMYQNSSDLEKARSSMRSSSWTGMFLVPDLARISRGSCETQWILSVYCKTIGKPHAEKGKSWKAPRYTASFLPIDAVGEGRGYVDSSTEESPSGLSERGMRTAIKDLLERGLISNEWIDSRVAKGMSRAKAVQEEAAATATGEEWYHWRLCPETWATESVPRKQPATAATAKGAESEDEFVENTDTSDETGGSTIPRVAWAPPKIKGGSKPVRLRPGAVEQTGILVIREFEVPMKVRYSGPPDTDATVTRILDADGLSYDVEVHDHRKPAPPPSPPLASQPRGASGSPAAGRRINLEHFPEFVKTITGPKAFPATDEKCLTRIIAGCYAAVPNTPEIVSDEFILRAAINTQRPKTSAALYEKTLPTWFKNSESKLKAELAERRHAREAPEEDYITVLERESKRKGGGK